MINSVCSKSVFIFLLLPFLCLGQAKYQTGEVTYGVDLDIERLKDVKSSNRLAQQYVQNTLKEVKKTAAGVTCVLKFNSISAHFFAEEGLENDAGSSYKSALMHFGIDGPYYVNLKKKEILQKLEAFGKTYLVQEEFSVKQKWTISSESRQIGKYKVYKAMTIKVVVNEKGTHESDVIAWFAPEIPFSFGPVGYGGLPGLILELEEETKFPVRFYAKTVDFRKEEIKIEVPYEEQKITAEELDEMYRGGWGN